MMGAGKVIEWVVPPCPFRVTSVALGDRWLPIDFRYALFATEVHAAVQMTRWAMNRHR